jgi:predicted amidohydrolase YtcJ
MLIRRAELAGIGTADVKITGSQIVACGPGLRRGHGEDELDAAGGALLPGLHDHHIHLRALAASATSVPAGPPTVRSAAQLARRLAAADRMLPPGQWIRCVGYHESVAGPLDRWLLDGMLAHRPVRVQHRTGALWVLNSLAAAQVRLDECDHPGVERDGAHRPTGRLWRMDSWLAERIPGAAAPDLAAVSRRAAAMGITGFTDATPDLRQADIGTLAAAVGRGDIVQRLTCMAPPETAGPTGARFSLGPVKILLDDAALPALSELGERVRAAHAAGRPVAVHCVTRVQFVVTLAALGTAVTAPGDRIEHGAVIPGALLPRLRERAVTVVTQPHFVVERGDSYLRDVPPEDVPDLWRLRSLLDAGVAVAAGTDAPFGTPDPWLVMRAAMARPAGLGGAEAISGSHALRLFLGRPATPAKPRLVAPGQVADLVLLRAPAKDAAAAPSAGLVAATIVDGEPVYLAEP